MLDSKPSGQQNGFSQQGQQQAPQQQYNKPAQQQGGFQQQAKPQRHAQLYNHQQGQQQAPKVNPQESSIDFDDDIPF